MYPSSNRKHFLHCVRSPDIDRFHVCPSLPVPCKSFPLNLSSHSFQPIWRSYRDLFYAGGACCPWSPSHPAVDESVHSRYGASKLDFGCLRVNLEKRGTGRRRSSLKSLPAQGELEQRRVQETKNERDGAGTSLRFYPKTSNRNEEEVRRTVRAIQKPTFETSVQNRLLNHPFDNPTNNIVRFASSSLLYTSVRVHRSIRLDGHNSEDRSIVSDCAPFVAFRNSDLPKQIVG